MNLHLPLGNLASRAPANILPAAGAFVLGNATFCNSVLHRHAGGGLRQGDSRPLLNKLRNREIAISDVAMSYRPDVSDEQVNAALPPPQQGHTSPEHRRLVLHAQLLALGWSADGIVEAEYPVTPGRNPLRCDVATIDEFGRRIALEAGATDTARIPAILDGTTDIVVVLPYAGLHYPLILGYAFAHPGKAHLPPLTAADGRCALATLLPQMRLTV
jgi:hypothetical protein